jgi:enoyl-[acyl-carrier protein] reductase II
VHKLDNCLIDREQAQYAAERFWIGALKNAVIDGDVTKGSLMAGQSVGLVDEVKPLKSIIDEMIDDAESGLQRLKQVINEATP